MPFHISTVSPPVLSASAVRPSTRTHCGAGEGGEGGEGDEAATPAGKGAVERGKGAVERGRGAACRPCCHLTTRRISCGLLSHSRYVFVCLFVESLQVCIRMFVC